MTLPPNLTLRPGAPLAVPRPSEDHGKADAVALEKEPPTKALVQKNIDFRAGAGESPLSAPRREAVPGALARSPAAQSGVSLRKSEAQRFQRSASPITGIEATPISAEELTEEGEKDTLKKTGGKAVIRPYRPRNADPNRPIDRTQPPVVLVHGFGNSGGKLVQMAEALAEKGRQVFIVQYDDQHTQMRHSGQQLARGLRRLKSHYPDTMPLDIIGHSLGGAVARVALNDLCLHRWTDGNHPAQPLPRPRAGFGRVRLRALDTAWGTYRGEEPLPRFPDAVMGGVLEIADLFTPKTDLGRGGAQMRGKSELWNNLFVKLPEVDIQTIGAQSEGDMDRHPSLNDLERETQSMVLEHLLNGKELENGRLVNGKKVSKRRLRNLVEGLKQDGRFDAFLDRLKAEAQTKPVESIDLLAIHDEEMRHAQGTHSDMIVGQGLIDRLCEELGRAPSP